MPALKANEPAPDFHALDSNGVEVRLGDFTGKTIVLYFYPKDNTSGCTIEAQDFTALLGDFEKLNCVVIGISPDSQKSHQNFIAKKSLKHILLCDEDKQIATSYGAYGEKIMYGKKVLGIIRSTFIIDSNGNIAKTYYNIRAKDHAAKLLSDLQSLQTAN